MRWSPDARTNATAASRFRPRPRFGIVGQTQTITYRLDDQGVSGERARIVVRRDGEVINERTLLSGQTANVDIDIKHAGPNIVEIEASPLAERTDAGQ